jgi:hypothetical protein
MILVETLRLLISGKGPQTKLDAAILFDELEYKMSGIENTMWINASYKCITLLKVTSDRDQNPMDN